MGEVKPPPPYLMETNPNIFRQYDIRGIADQDLTDPVVEKIGRAIGSYYLRGGVREAIVGQDIRISSPRIAKALTSALQETGIDVIEIGTVPTPVLYFSLFHYDKSAGIMITGSHNPKAFNGMKICFNKTSIYGDEIQRLRTIAEGKIFNIGKGRRTRVDPIPDYIDEILSRVVIKNVPFLVLDPGNGTVGPIIDGILSKLGLDYEIMNKNPDGNFPVHLPDPTVVEYVEPLIQRVKEKGGVGIGFDGDGDRIGVINEDGEIVWGDHLLGIYAKPIIEHQPGARIIFEVKCSRGLIEYIESLGGVPIMYKTGHSLIKAKMKEESALIAGEMSGHMFFADNYYGYDDAIFAALRLLEILSEEEKSLKELDQEIPRYFSTPEIRIDCPDREKFKVVETVKEEFSKRNKVITIDGVRIEYPDGWGLIRPSNTQPILVLRFEAKTEERLEEIRSEVIDFLKRFPELKINL